MRSRVAVALVALGALAGCGYRLVGTASNIPPEIRVVRRGTSRGDLERHRVVIDGSPSHLVVHAESPVPSCWVLSDDASQEVTLFVPESVSVSTLTVSEATTIG